jgi:hypothetical protein
MFMIIVLALGWIVSLFYSKALLGVLIAFGPVWVAVYLFEIFFPYTLPVRIDRKEGFVYIGHRGTFYRIPWDELEVTFSYNWQYLGSGVVWERQYYAHLFMREKHYFCGKPPRCPYSARRSFLGLRKRICIGNGISLSGITTRGLLKRMRRISTEQIMTPIISTWLAKWVVVFSGMYYFSSLCRP